MTRRSTGNVPAIQDWATGPWPVIILIILAVAVLGWRVLGIVREDRREVRNLGRQVAAMQGVSSLRKEMETLTANEASLRREVGEIRDLVRKQAAPPQPTAQREIVMPIAGTPFRGNPNAPVTLVEFTDFECGFCGRYVKDTYPQIERDYIVPGKLRYFLRNFPLESIHKQAFQAHLAAACALEGGKFWEMHDKLFANQKALLPADLARYAEAIGLDEPRFQACLATDASAKQVRQDMAEGQKAGVTGTPTFFLGRTGPNASTLKVSKTLVGSKPYSSFKEDIEALLLAPSSQ